MDPGVKTMPDNSWTLPRPRFSAVILNLALLKLIIR